MGDVQKVIQRALTPPGTGGQEAMAEQASADARAQASQAADERLKAVQVSAAAAAGDSEQERRAAEAKLRSRLSQGGFAVASTMSPATIGYRNAFGG